MVSNFLLGDEMHHPHATLARNAGEALISRVTIAHRPAQSMPFAANRCRSENVTFLSGAGIIFLTNSHWNLTIRAIVQGPDPMSLSPLPARRRARPRSRRAVVPQVRAAPLLGLAHVLEEFGVDCEGVLRELGLRPGLLQNPDNTLPFTTAGRLFGRCVELTGCRHLGILLGRNRGLSVLGTVGLLAQSAPNVRHALDAISCHLHLHDRGSVVRMHVNGSQAIFSYAVLAEAVESADQIIDFAVMVARNILAALCGPAWSPTEVRFAHRAPEDLAPFQEAFHAPLRFDADVSGVVFPAHWLDKPVMSADPLLHRYMMERVNELAAMSGDDFLAQSRRAVHASLSSHDCSLASIARRLALSPRTLNRRLRESGTSFAQLLADTRKSEATRILENTKMAAGQVAALLGYSSDSAFSRAFKSWFGVGPARWRANVRSKRKSAPKR